MKQKFLTILSFLPLFFFSQQPITLQQAEAQFLRNNLELIAAQYELSIAEAEIVQAGIWELPEVSFESNLVRPSVPSFFNIGPTKTLSVEQLFLLGGKRRHEVALAKSHKDLATLQLSQLLADLRAELRTTFYTLFFEYKKRNNIDSQLVYMKDLMEAYRIQTQRGNIALRDQVRLQSIITALSADRLEITNEITEGTKKLGTLLGTTEHLIPEMSDAEEMSILQAAPLGTAEQLQQVALTHNADYLYANKLIENSRLNHQLQKSMNVPDVTAGLIYNQSSGVYQNEINFGLSIPLPLWKRNAGNIRAAELQVQQAQNSRNFAELALRNTVSAAYEQWQNQYQFYQSVPQKEYDNLESVYQGMTTNFRKGNVTLLDFTDFMESYRQTALQRFETEKQILLSGQELRRLTQTPIFND